tara:strand:- start:3748 stop:4521 length:774 start_codon:yes stop_codon:yes gene_type:complete
MTKATELAEAGTKELAVFDITTLERDAGQGLDMGPEDMALPFLKILSGNDPVLDEIETARKGDLYNTVTGVAFKGKEGVRVVPCAYQRRFIKWAPRGSGNGAPTGIYEQGQPRPKTKRSTEDNKDYCVDGSGEYIEETHQHFVLLVNDDGTRETALMALKSTQLKKSRKWNSMIASRTLPGKNGPFTPARFSYIYRITTSSEENSKGSWHGYEISLEGLIEDGSLYARAKAFADSITADEVVVKHADDEVAETEAPF